MRARRLHSSRTRAQCRVHGGATTTAGTLIHSDQGTQYGSDAWRRFCHSNHLEHGARLIRNLVALATQVSEIELVKRDRPHRDDLFALQGAQPIARRVRIERVALERTEVASVIVIFLMC
jgi:hypothetical protein